MAKDNFTLEQSATKFLGTLNDAERKSLAAFLNSPIAPEWLEVYCCQYYFDIGTVGHRPMGEFNDRTDVYSQSRRR
jgi:hypothetical protein